MAPQPTASLQQQQRQGELELKRLADMQRQRAAQLAVVQKKADIAKARRDASRKLDLERERNLRQLETPNPELDDDGDPLAVDEDVIRYWSPVLERYVIERVRL